MAGMRLAALRFSPRAQLPKEDRKKPQGQHGERTSLHCHGERGKNAAWLRQMPEKFIVSYSQHPWLVPTDQIRLPNVLHGSMT